MLIDVNYIFGVLTSRTNDWYINESNSEWVGGVGWDFGGCSTIIPDRFQQMFNIYFEFLSSSPFVWHLGWVFDLRGSGCLVTEMYGMPPSKPWVCVQANYQQLIQTCSSQFPMIKLYE